MLYERWAASWQMSGQFIKKAHDNVPTGSNLRETIINWHTLPAALEAFQEREASP